MTNSKLVAAVILAGGQSVRFGKSFKQFAKINGKPLISYSLGVFIKCKFIQNIIIIAPKRRIAYANRLVRRLNDSRIQVVEGGEYRRQSALKALIFLKRISPDYVIFHDAARPFISQEMVSGVLAEASRTGGAVIATKATDLVLKADNHKFIKSVSQKEKIFFGHTPQCFQFDLILAAHLKCAKILQDADNIELVLNTNKRARINVVEYSPAGSPKLTYKQDLMAMRLFLRN